MRMRWLVIAVVCLTTGRGHADLLPVATLRLAPVCDGGMATAIDVALTLPWSGTPVFQLDDSVMGTAGMAKLVGDATASDDRGAVPIARRVHDGVLELAASRAIVGSITLRYRAHSVATTDRGAREGLRHDATGIGGLGQAFIALPETNRAFRLHLAWGSTCGQGTSSLGDGDLEVSGDLSVLQTAAYFAGHPRTFAADDGSMHVRSSWFGTTAFDAADAAAWAARAFAAERAFWGDTDPTPYRIFVRVLAAMGERANGTGHKSAFLSAIGPRTSFGARLRSNLAHEMFHRWLGMQLRLAGPEGSAYWFSEGFTVFYAGRLMLRAGLVSPDEFVAELDGTAARHFANAHAAATNDEIRRGFFTNDELSVVPYTRGALYAAELDAAIRNASHGTRSLDDVMRALPRRELPATAVRDAIVRELGATGAGRYDAVIDHGATPQPPSDAFGPCFERVPRSYPLYQLGFDARQPTVKLVPGSAAAKAGLVDGDAIVAIDTVNLMADREAVVTVRRGGVERVFRYLPAGAKRDGYAWQRVPGIADARCRP